MNPATTKLADDVLALLGHKEVTGMVADNVRCAVQCLSEWFGIGNAAALASYVRGIDLHREVRRMDLVPPRQLVGYRQSSEASFHGGGTFNAFGMYFTDAGTSKHDAGLGARTDNARLLKYELIRRTPCLRSTAAFGAISGFGQVQGGAVQYIIPLANTVMRVVHIQHTLR